MSKRDTMGVNGTRKIFLKAFLRSIGILWPIPAGIVTVMLACGFVIGIVESWSVQDTLYFTFVTGLTIGYGDLTPQHLLSRILSIIIGFSGIVLTGLVAAVGVQALRATGIDPNS